MKSFCLILITFFVGLSAQAQSTLSKAKTLNVDFMLRGNFYAYSSVSEGLGGYWASANLPKPSADDQFPANELGIVVDTANFDTLTGQWSGFKVYLYNNAVYPAVFEAQDSRLSITLQAKDAKGEWRDIMYQPNSWCGNSYHSLELKPGEHWTFVTPQFEGKIKTEVRLKLEKWHLRPTSTKPELVYDTAFSNSYSAHVNPEQFEVQKEYNAVNIMDPYDN